MFSYYFDPTYVLVIIAFLLTLFASMGVKSTFSKYNDVRSSRGNYRGKCGKTNS